MTADPYREKPFSDDPERDFAEWPEEHVMRVVAHRLIKHGYRCKTVLLDAVGFWRLAMRMLKCPAVAEMSFGELRLWTAAGPISFRVAPGLEAAGSDYLEVL